MRLGAWTIVGLAFILLGLSGCVLRAEKLDGSITLPKDGVILTPPSSVTIPPELKGDKILVAPVPQL